MPHPVGKKCLCILGMHRSGTSSLTGIAQQYGVELGEVFTENPHNRRGNREHAGIQALNNDVLTFNGGNWDRPVEVRHWNVELVERRDRIIEEISQRADTWWGFKDPRVMLTLPFWQEGIGPDGIYRYVSTSHKGGSVNCKEGPKIHCRRDYPVADIQPTYASIATTTPLSSS